MRTLYVNETGPLVRAGGGMLHINDLNPEIGTQWRMTRWEMFCFGLRAIKAALLN